MDFVIQNWNHIRTLKSLSSNGPSLQMIVEHFMELDNDEQTLKMTGTSHGEEETKMISISKDNNLGAESSIDGQERNKRDGLQKLDTVVNEQLSPLEITLKTELDKLKKEIQELKDGARKTELDMLKKEIKELKDEVKKEIKELKDEFMKQHSEKNETREEQKRMRLKRWDTMRSALDKYDVSMEGIQAFQRFRFYCIAGHLTWPFPEQVQRQKNIDNYED
ncbi:uncharacterized protein LOC131065933 [Cryptomeria japonica]|uniref:uncharacterized protein LOC131065933 n=1 Tax=Cryptomeria japonica TaxID=3369 RepID=UPI0027D9D944|nr:uncharacterized protein LOC131065933 [Cryptomeria japonica]